MKNKINSYNNNRKGKRRWHRPVTVAACCGGELRVN